MFPKQRLSYKDKIKDNQKWGEDCLKYICTYSNEYSGIDNNGDSVQSRSSQEYQNKISNYKLFNNQIDQKEFERECNPWGLDLGQTKDIIQAYNKAPTKIQAILGEELKRPFDYICSVIDNEGIKLKQEGYNHQLKHLIEKDIAQFSEKLKNAIEHQQIDPKNLEQHLSEEFNEFLPQEKINKFKFSTYQDKNEMANAKLLKFITRNQNIQDKKNDAFKHGVIAGEELLWVGIRNNRFVIEVLNPLNTFYHKSPECKFIEDGLYAGYRYYTTISDAMDTYQDYLTEDQLDRLESYMNSGNMVDKRDAPDAEIRFTNRNNNDANWKLGGSQMSATEGSYGHKTYQDILITHVEWKSQRKVGFLTFTNEFGEKEETTIDEEFEVPKNANKSRIQKLGMNTEIIEWTDPVTQQFYSLTYKWIPEVWEGVRIGGDIYCCIRPKQYKSMDLDDPSAVELGYRGVVYNNMNAINISMMDRMKPYIFLYMIVVHKLKKLIAHDKGKVFHFDVSMIPKEIGLEKALHYLDNMNIDFYNPLMNAEQAGTYQRGKVTSATDRSNMQHILNYVQLMQAIDNEISDVVGITRSREGQTTSSQSVTNAQQDLAQSYNVTEIYFNLHNKVWERALDYALSIAVPFYKKNNKLIQFALDDLTMETINMSEIDGDRKVRVYVTNSISENKIFNQLQAWGQSLIQNDKANLSHLITILEGRSVAEIKTEIRAFEAEQNQREQQMQESQTKAAQEALAYDRETKIMLENIKTEREIQKAEIQSFAFQKDQDIDDNGIPDQLETDKFVHDQYVDEQQLKLKKRELDIKQQIANKPTPKSK